MMKTMTRQKTRKSTIVLDTPISEGKRRPGFLGYNKGLPCPFRTITCQEGWCQNCEIFQEDYLKIICN